MPIDKKPGETKDDFMGRCIGIEINAGKDPSQAAAICYAKWDEMKSATQSVTDNTWSTEAPIKVELESYTDYPESAKSNAQRALDWAAENGWGDCGTEVGKIRANQLAKGEPISRDTIARMAAFERHRQNSTTPYGEGCGKLMWDAWGGDEGIEWAQRKLEQIDSQNLAKVNLARISMDYDDTLSTERGKALAERLIRSGNTLYIVSARRDKSGMLGVAESLGIPASRVYATGSNRSKVEKVKELGVDKHYDNNLQVVRDLPGIGDKFKAHRRIIFNEDFDLETVKKYKDAGYQVHIRSARKIKRNDNKVWNKLKSIGITQDALVFGEVKDLDARYNYDLLMTGEDPILEKLLISGEPADKYRTIRTEVVTSLQEATEKAEELVKSVDLKFVRVLTRYRYTEIPGIPTAKSGSRPFCSKLMVANKLYSAEEIQNLPTSHLTDMGLPADPFQYRGGFYRNPDSQVTTPWCRHQWQVEIVVER